MNLVSEVMAGQILIAAYGDYFPSLTYKSLSSTSYFSDWFLAMFPQKTESIFLNLLNNVPNNGFCHQTLQDLFVWWPSNFTSLVTSVTLIPLDGSWFHLSPFALKVELF